MDKIEAMGSAFRGLWLSRDILPDLSLREGWSVTFVYNGQFVETPYQDSAEAALDYALGILKKGVEC